MRRVTTLGRKQFGFFRCADRERGRCRRACHWTDVDGIYTANPHELTEAKLLHELSYDQAHALAAAGAKVLHAKVFRWPPKPKWWYWVRTRSSRSWRGTRIGQSSLKFLHTELVPCHNSIPKVKSEPAAIRGV